MPTVSLVGPALERREVREALERAGITIVAEGETVGEVADAAGDVLVLSERSTAEERTLQETLTLRERQVLDLLADGLSNRRVAERLGISEHTVKFHVTSIYGKLGASSRAEVIRRAARRGLITI